MGDWKARLSAITPDVENPVRRFDEFIHAFLDSSDDVILRHIALASPAILDESATSACLEGSERRRWEDLYSELKRTYLKYRLAQSFSTDEPAQNRDLFCFSWPEQSLADVDRSHSTSAEEDEKQSVALITAYPKDLSYLTIWGYLFFLATQWHVERGGLSLHSSAVARGSDGFLFLGQSKAGKSTVAELSASIGLSALGDDLNFVIPDGESGYRLAASPSPSLPSVGYSMQKPRLRGIFVLVQDDRDYLVPVEPLKMAPLLFHSFIQQTPYVRRVSNALVGKAFQTVCDLSRRIPGYELHFKKSADFWKIIDERFPE